jgi:hypothetical protein
LQEADLGITDAEVGPNGFDQKVEHLTVDE